MRVIFSPAAARQADEIDLWWRDHRGNAPDAFTEELASALAALAATPRLGALYTRVKRPGVRRIFLRRTGYHLYFVCAAVLEVGGDAMIRRGLRGGGTILIALGVVVLGAYGVVVNLLQLDFSRLLGAYIGIFAVVSVVAGRLVFSDRVPASTWIGLAIVLVGSVVIHVGRA